MQNKSIKEIAKHLKELKKSKDEKNSRVFLLYNLNLLQRKREIPQIWNVNPLFFGVFIYLLYFFFISLLTSISKKKTSISLLTSKMFYSEFVVNYKVVGV